MKEKFFTRWACALSLVAVAACSFASDRPEPNAFLNKRAKTVQDLIRAVQNDPEVADRYVRHFGKSREDVVEYFRTLHLAKLNQTGTYTIYSVDDHGVIKSHPELLRAGTVVYADSAGTPILKATCGNALVSGSNQVTSIVNPAVGPMVDTMKTVTGTFPDPMTTSFQTASQMPIEPIAIAPVFPDTVTTGSSNQGFALPAALAAIGGAGAFLIGGNGSNPVPEPASIIVIAGAVAAFKMRRKAKK